MNKNKVMEDALLKCVPCILLELHRKYADKFLDVLYESVVRDVDISFDSDAVYLFSGDRSISILLNESTPLVLTKSLVEIIRTRQMTENIRDQNNKILFRGYKGNTSLNKVSYEFRNELWKGAASLVDEKEGILIVWRKLYLKFINLQNVGDDENLNQVLECIRLKNILSSIKLLLQKQ